MELNHTFTVAASPERTWALITDLGEVGGCFPGAKVTSFDEENFEGEGTKVDVVTDLSITGKPAQFGRGVMQSVSDKLLGQFVDCLESKLTEDA